MQCDYSICELDLNRFGSRYCLSNDGLQWQTEESLLQLVRYIKKKKKIGMREFAPLGILRSLESFNRLLFKAPSLPVDCLELTQSFLIYLCLNIFVWLSVGCYYYSEQKWWVSIELKYRYGDIMPSTWELIISRKVILDLDLSWENLIPWCM